MKRCSGLVPMISLGLDRFPGFIFFQLMDEFLQVRCRYKASLLMILIFHCLNELVGLYFNVIKVTMTYLLILIYVDVLPSVHHGWFGDTAGASNSFRIE